MPIMTTLRPGTAARSSGTRRSSARDIAAESDSKTSGAAAVTCSVTCDAKADAPTTSMLLFFLRIRVRASRSSLFSARMKSNIDVVGASAMASQVTEQVTTAAPDVLLSDSAAMSLAELRLVPELRAAVPGLKVVMIGMDADRETFLRAVRDGVVGYMLKDASA